MNKKNISKTSLFLLLILLFFLGACSQEIEQAAQEESPILSQKANLEGTNTNSYIEFVSCEEDTLTFTIYNKGLQTWSLDRYLLNEEEGAINVRLFMNGYVINPSIRNPTTQIHKETGEQLFGPNKLFSENCEGTSFLMSQEQTTCTITNLPLQEENTLWMEGEGRDDQITFRCEQ